MKAVFQVETPGAKEAAAGTVAVRQRKGGEQSVLSVDDFIARLKKEVAERVNG